MGNSQRPVMEVETHDGKYRSRICKFIIRYRSILLIVEQDPLGNGEKYVKLY